MIDRLRLRADVVLVLLAPTSAEQLTAGGLYTAPATTPVACYGRVLRTGPRVRDVARGDLVAFPPSAGEPIDVRNYHLLFVREPEIAFVVTKDVKES